MSFPEPAPRRRHVKFERAAEISNTALVPDARIAIGGFTYAPGATFAGTDTFTYRASDGTVRSSPATATPSRTTRRR